MKNCEVKATMAHALNRRLQACLLLAAAVAFVVASEEACNSPFTRQDTLCVYYNESVRVSWCEAAELCMAIGGELAVDLELIRDVGQSINSSAGYVWIGATDLLVEQARNRTGWRWTNGSVVTAQEVDWDPMAPSDSGPSGDFLAVASTGLADIRFEYGMGYLCQPVVTPESGRFKRVAFLRLGDISPDYCYTDLFNMPLEKECALRCARRWQCRAALYNSADARCRMLDFTDASVGDHIELDPNWSKLVKVY